MMTGSTSELNEQLARVCAERDALNWWVSELEGDVRDLRDALTDILLTWRADGYTDGWRGCVAMADNALKKLAALEDARAALSKEA